VSITWCAQGGPDRDVNTLLSATAASPDQKASCTDAQGGDPKQAHPIVDCRNRRYSLIRREAKVKRCQTNLLKRNALMVVQLQVGVPRHYLQKAGEDMEKMWNCPEEDSWK
jgi:hypothetical protein